MRKGTGMSRIAAVALALSVAGSGFLFGTGIQHAEAAVTCTPTGFFRDAINMTAAKINPAGTVSGDVDATGCNIGVYYSSGKGSVKQANIHGANYFGVLVSYFAHARRVVFREEYG